VQIKKAASETDLQQLVQQYGSSMNYIHLSAAVNTLGNWQQQGKLSSSWQQQQAQLLFADVDSLLMPEILDQCDRFALAQLMWGLGLLRYTQSGLFGDCLGMFMQQLDQAGRAQDVSMVLIGAARAGWEMEGGQVQQLLAALMRLLPDAQAVANSLWAVATMGHTLSEQPLQQLLAALLRLLPYAMSQHVANSLWAVATMGKAPTEQQLQQLLAALVRLLPDATPQDVANSLWAAATMGRTVTGQQLLQLLQHLTSNPAKVKTQDVANSLWAAAKLAQQLTDQQRQELQKLQHLQLLLSGLAGKLPAAEPQHVSNSLWACAQLRVYPAELFAALDSHQQWCRLLPAMSEQDLANTALACAVLDHRDEQLLAGLLQHALQLQAGSSSDSNSGQLTDQGLCNICWSVAVLDLQQLAGSVVQLVQAATSSQQQWVVNTAGGLRQLHQVHLWLLDRQLVGGRGLAGALTQQQLQQCSEAWIADLRAAAAESPTALQQQVFAALRQLTAASQMFWQQPPAMEQLAVPDGACLIDIAGVTAYGVQLAIEVDGPYPFLRPGRRLDGSTQHRNRVLAARSYAVVSVPYFV
jgi:hypothetical protein